MNFELEINFRNSSSTYLEDVLSKAKKFDKFESSKSKSQKNKLKIGIQELVQKFALYKNVILSVSTWKGTEILVNGIPQNRNQLFEIEKFIGCYNEYEKAVIQENHCKLNDHKEGWGCKHLDSISRYNEVYYYRYNLSKNWFEFGEFTSEKIWRINKKEIIKILKRERDLKYLNHCPIFDFDKIKNIVKNLPAEINLAESDFWEIKYEANEDGAQLEKKPIGIRPKKAYDNELGVRISIGGDSKDEDGQNRESNRYIPDVSYADIGGIDDILQKIREVIEIPIKNPEMFSYLGIKPHKGILLYGPPGCGKTLVAKAIANQVNAHFISIKGPELISKWHGQSEENLRFVFEEARRLQPSIIFFDEIDSIAQRRSSEESLRFDSRFVNQLLTLMDGMEEYSNVKVIGTTNRIELIDEGLLRSGRFDYHIEINKPNGDGCIKIFNIHTEKMPIEANFDKNYFASKLVDLTGADIAFITREGAFNCLRRNLKKKLIKIDSNFEGIEFENFIINEEDFLKAYKSLSK